MIARSALATALALLLILGCAAARTTYEPALAELTPRLETRHDLADLEQTGQRFFVAGTGEPATGRVEGFHPDGSRKARFTLVDGRATGLWIEWRANGQVRYLGEWINGAGTGTWYYFHPNGEVAERVHVRDDVFVGVAEGWTEGGDKAFEAVNRDGARMELWRREG